MKKVFTLSKIVALFVFAGATSAVAQPTQKISINLFSLPVRTLNLAYEKQVSESVGLQMAAYYFFGYNENWGDGQTYENKTKFSGWGAIPELRFYPMGNGIKGFYVGPHIRFRHFDFNTTEKDITNGTTTDLKSNWNQIGGGVVVGGQWHFGDKVNFDVYGGPGFTSTSVKYEGTADANDFDSGRLGNGNFYFRTGVRLGYSF